MTDAASPNDPHMNSDTQLSILRAAEELFAAKSVDRVSLREISVAAGQRNHSAVQYHFRDKAGLIDAIVARHSDPIHAMWMDTLDILELGGGTTLEALLTLLIRPIASKLDDPDGGTAYIRLCAQLVVHPTYSIFETRSSRGDAAQRLLTEVTKRAKRSDRETAELRVRRLVQTIYLSCLAFEQLRAREDASLGLDDFVAGLVEDLEGSLAPR